MKKIICLILALLCLCSCGESKLPTPEVESGMRGELGIDKNINESTIDNYLNRKDSVYRDMRMLVDEANYEAIGGDSYLSGIVEGFEVVPYPYLCNVEGLPEEVGDSYSGETLFTHVDGEYIANYEESMDILESLFPKDKYIFLMCGGGGYAGMTKQLLVGLGWDENKIYNVGGYWYYDGTHNVEIKYEENGQTHYDYSKLVYHNIDFDSLTSLGNTYEDNQEEKSVEKQIEESNTIVLESIDELDDMENQGMSFPLFIYTSGCPVCANLYSYVEQFVSENNIQIYAIEYNKEIFQSSNSISNRISYTPSLFIYKDGKVIAYLNPSSDDDKVYYQSYDDFVNWINSNIDISELECSACSLN